MPTNRQSLSTPLNFFYALSLCLIATMIPASAIGGSLPFTENVGQWPDSILFRASASGATMWFTKNGIWYQFYQVVEKTAPSATSIDPLVPSLDALPGKFDHQNDSVLTTMVKAEFVGASSSVEVLGLEEMEYKCNYFMGNDKSQWRGNVPNYTAVTMKGLYPGVDVSFSSQNGLLKQEVMATSTAALAQVKVEYRGAAGVTPVTTSEAIVQTSLGEHTFEGIMLADQVVGKTSTFSNKATSAGGVELAYSSLFGGDGQDWGQAIAIDSDGCAYITGTTLSTNFPTDTGYHAINSIWYDGFLAKLSPSGSSVLYCTYIGGWEGDDCGWTIKVDGSEQVYVCGYTSSNDFPSLDFIQGTNGAGDHFDIFIIGVSKSGDSLLFSTAFGGSLHENPYSLCIDKAGLLVIAGTTTSNDFPVAHALQNQLGGEGDFFLVKLDAKGDSLVFSTFLGGGEREGMPPFASIDSKGDIIMAGWASPRDFIFQTDIPDSSRYGSFLMKVSGDGDSLLYGRYFHDPNIGPGSQFALDDADNVYMANSSGHMVKYSLSQDTIVFDCFISNGAFEWVTDVSIDDAGASYVGGQATSSFTTLNAFQDSFRGGATYHDCWVAKVAPNGSLSYSTFLGGTAREWANGLAADNDGNVYVVGLTGSPDFPIYNSYQNTVTFASSVFVTKLAAYGGSNCCQGDRGNVDGDPAKLININDLAYLAARLFTGGPPSSCFDEADVDTSSTINILDLMFLVRHLFSSGPPPPACQ